MKHRPENVLSEPQLHFQSDVGFRFLQPEYINLRVTSVSPGI